MLPDLSFADTDPRRIEMLVMTGYEAAARAAGMGDFRLYPGDPRRLFLQSIAMLIVQQNALIDKTGKGNLLRFAGEDTIEDLGYLFGPRGARLQASPALTTIEFRLSAARPTVTTIPAGIRVTAGDLIFKTQRNLDIPAGMLTGTVTAECVTVGMVGNGLLPGQISTLVDRLPFVESIVNTTESTGGADIEDIEAYRTRLRLVPSSFSVAGPDGAYIFWAKTASPSIIDVAVWMPEPGHVNVVPLLVGGQVPGQEILDAVNAILSDRTVRPLTDSVHVLMPELAEFELDMTYWIDIANTTRATEIQAAVESAVMAYIEWQQGALGRDIIPDVLVKMVMAAGARRVEITSPAFTVVERGHIARLTLKTVTYGGLEAA